MTDQSTRYVDTTNDALALAHAVSPLGDRLRAGGIEIDPNDKDAVADALKFIMAELQMLEVVVTDHAMGLDEPRH